MLLLATQQMQRLGTSKRWWHRLGRTRPKRQLQWAGLQAARRRRHRVGSGSRPLSSRAQVAPCIGRKSGLLLWDRQWPPLHRPQLMCCGQRQPTFHCS